MRRQNSRHWLCTLHTGVCYIVKSGIYKYTSYGILAARDLRGCQQVVQFISDVSLDRAFVEALARRCTAAQLDPCHLLDVVEDAISG